MELGLSYACVLIALAGWLADTFFATSPNAGELRNTFTYYA